MIVSTHGILANSGSVPFAGLLDTYSASRYSSYSLRRLTSTYTGPAIRVRRSSDNTSQDIGFYGNGNLDTSSLLSFVGSGSGYVSIFYDQVFYNNFTQTTQANQPIIVSSGTLLTDNGKPTISYGTQSNQYCLISPSGFLNGFSTPLYMFNTWKITDWTISNAAVFGPSTTFNNGLEILQHSVITRRSLLRINTQKKNDLSANTYQMWNDAQTTLTTVFVSPSFTAVLKNNATINMTDTSGIGTLNNISDSYAIGRYGGSAYAYMNQQEMIFYTADKASDRLGISNNINSYYTIY
jgi:hypothetical protein